MESPPAKSKLLRHVLTLGVLLFTFGFIARGIFRQWDELLEYEWTINPYLLAFSFVIAASWFFLRARIWQLIVVYMGVRIRYREAFRIWALSELGRYLPGKLWYVLGRSYLAGQKGISAPVALTSMAMELALVMLSASVFFLIHSAAALDAGGNGVVQTYRTLSMCILPVILLIVHPRVLLSIVNFGLRKMKKPEIDARLGYGQLLRLFGLCCLMWLSFGLAFFAFTRSICGLGWGDFMSVASAYAIAWVIGLITVVSPGGLGVRETALSLLLASCTPLGPAALVVALMSRIWVTIAELLCAAAALKM